MARSIKQPSKLAKLDYGHAFSPVAGLLGSSAVVESKFGKRMVKQTNSHATYPSKAPHVGGRGWKVAGNSGLDIGLSAELGTSNSSFAAMFVITPLALSVTASLLSTKYNTSINWGALELAIGPDGHPDFNIIGNGSIYSGTAGPALKIGQTSTVIFLWDFSLGATAVQVFVDGKLHGTASSQGYTLPTYTQCVVGKLAFDHTGRDPYILHGFAYSNRTKRLSTELLTTLSGDPWQLWKEPSDILKAATNSGTTISCTLGDATASGLDTAVINSTIIAAETGNATASGLDAAIVSGNTINCVIGDATASGLDATVTNITTINCTIGDSVANGLDATVTNDTTQVISCDVGICNASGLDANVATSITISCTVGAATASGLDSIITNGQVISTLVGDAVATGLDATVIQSTNIASDIGIAVASGFDAAVTNFYTINTTVGSAVATGLTASITATQVIICDTGVAVAEGLVAFVDASFTAIEALKTIESDLLFAIAVSHKINMTPKETNVSFGTKTYSGDINI